MNDTTGMIIMTILWGSCLAFFVWLAIEAAWGHSSKLSLLDQLNRLAAKIRRKP